MIKQFLMRRGKIARGVLYTYFRSKAQNYHDREWWDNAFYTEGISDSKTISSKKNPISSKYHYNSIEQLIFRHLFNNSISINGSSVLDIGSGAGHWIDFYRSLGSSKTLGIDVSLSAVDYLKEKYSNYADVSIQHGKASERISKLDASFSIINAIGVMFHIVDDTEWIDTINKIAGVIQKTGLFIIGGYFGYFNGLNVQIDRNHQVNKRCRSKKHWKSTLKNAGFTSIEFYTNNAYLWINDTLPENNVLIATR